MIFKYGKNFWQATAAAALLSSSTAFAQTTSPSAAQTYDLAKTIQAALKSSSDLENAARNVEIDRKRADEASAASRPSIGATATGTYFDQPTKIAFGAGPPVVVVPRHTETLSAELTERFDFTGQIRATSNQYRLQALADEFTVQQTRNARVLRAKTIYFNLLRAEHQVQVAQAALLDAQNQQQNAQKLNAAQVGQKIDVLRANTTVAQDQQNVTSAQNNRDIARANFNDLVGQPLATPTTVVDVPGASVGVDVTNTSVVGTPTPQGQSPLTTAPADAAAINLDKSLQAAYATRPEYLAALVQVRVSDLGIKLARVGLEPNLSVSLGGEYYPDTSFQNPRQRVAQVTGTLTIPLYDGGATRDRIQEARLRTENAQTTAGSVKSGITLDVRQAYLNLQTASRQIEAANAVLQQAIAARQLAEIRYQGQVGLFLEVTDAQSALVQAESSQVNAVYDYLVARANFDNALGTPQLR